MIPSPIPVHIQVIIKKVQDKKELDLWDPALTLKEFNEYIVPLLEQSTELRSVRIHPRNPELPDPTRDRELPGFSRSLVIPMMQTIAKVLKRNSVPLSCFDGFAMRAEELIILAEALELNSTITTLNLWGSRIGIEGAKALAKALKKNSTLTTLNLGGNEMGKEGTQAIAAALPYSKLTSLDLGRNSISPFGRRSDPNPSEGAKAIAKALEHSGLSSIYLGGNNLNDADAIIIAKALKKSKLIEINFNNNWITGIGAKELAEAIEHSRLKIINLGDNDIGNEGAKAFAEVLKTNPALIELVLSKVGQEGINALSDALERNQTLTNLIPDNPTIQKHLERNRQEAKQASLRDATITSIFDKKGKFNKMQGLANPDLFQQIFSYADLQSDKSKIRQAKKEEETKHKQDSTLDPIEKIITFIQELPSEIKHKMGGKTNPQDMQKEITRAINVRMNEIIQDAFVNGYIFNFSDASKKIEPEIKNLKEKNTNTPFILEVSNQLQREWWRVIDEYNEFKPASRIITLIERLKAQTKSLGQMTEEQYKNMSDMISDRIDGIREYSKMQSYSFQKTDIDNIDAEITHFERLIKRHHDGEKLVKLLKEQYARLLSESTVTELPPALTFLQSSHPASVTDVNMPPSETGHTQQKDALQAEQTPDTKEAFERDITRDLFRILQLGKSADLERFKSLLQSANAKAKQNNRTLLHAACNSSNTDISLEFIKALLTQGADPNEKEKDPKSNRLVTCLDYAIINKRQDIVKLLSTSVISAEIWKQALDTYSKGSKKAEPTILTLIQAGLKHSQEVQQLSQQHAHPPVPPPPSQGPTQSHSAASGQGSRPRTPGRPH